MFGSRAKLVLLSIAFARLCPTSWHPDVPAEVLDRGYRIPTARPPFFLSHHIETEARWLKLDSQADFSSRMFVPCALCRYGYIVSSPCHPCLNARVLQLVACSACRE